MREQVPTPRRRRSSHHSPQPRSGTIEPRRWRQSARTSAGLGRVNPSDLQGKSMRICRSPRSSLRMLAWLAAAILAAATVAAEDSRPALDENASVDSLLAQAKAMEDPAAEAALPLLESAWNQASAAQRPEVAQLLAQRLVNLKQDARADEILRSVSRSEVDVPGLRAKLLLLHVGALTRLRQFGGAEALSAELEALSDSIPDYDLAAQLWHAMAVFHFSRGKPAEAEAAVRRGMQVLGDRQVPRRRELFELMGVSLAQQSRLPDAIEAMLEAERTAKQLGEPERADFLGNFGSLFIYAEDWPRAIDYLTRALALHDAQGAPAALRSRTLSNLGAAYNGKGDLASAAQYFQAALDLAREAELPLGRAMNNLAYALREQGRLPEALAMFEETLAANEASKDAEATAIAQKNIGETLVRLGQRERAADFLERAYRSYLDADIRPKRLELYPVIVENLEALGEHAEALRLMREFKDLNDETVTIDSNERIAKLESAIDLARTEQQLAISEGERLRQDAALLLLQADQARQRMWAAGLSAGLIALGLIAVLLYRQVRFKTRANHLLQEKNVEIQAQHARLAELNENIRQQSLRDALTGLPNRRFLEEHMRDRQAGESAREHGLLLMVDIDYFKRVNDQLGHLVGDQALIHVAEALLRCKRAQDLVVRWGGEEFLWLAHGADLDLAPALCSELQTQLSKNPFAHEGQAYPITVSIGFAPRPLWPTDDCDWTLSLRVADDALYEAKRSGRNHWVGFAPGSAPPLPLAQGLVAMTLASAGHLIRLEGGHIEEPGTTKP